jgi:hypothetical protein
MSGVQDPTLAHGRGGEGLGGGWDGKENKMAQFDISKYEKESRARFLFWVILCIYLFYLVLKQSIDGSEVVPDTWFELSPFGTQPHPRLPRRPLFPPSLSRAAIPTSLYCMHFHSRTTYPTSQDMNAG